LLTIISGPSAIGKDRLVSLAESHLGWRRIVPLTTRDRRQSEASGVDYHFMERHEFQTLILNRALYEWDYALQNYYGCRAGDVQDALGDPDQMYAMHALSRIGLRIWSRVPEVKLLALRMQDPEVVNVRLGERGMSPSQVELRHQHWMEEETHSAMFPNSLMGAESASDEVLLSTLSALQRPS
jgi:guanylate kinase